MPTVTEQTLPWPELPLEAWRETYETLHLWTQIVGKVKLALAHAQNHWWHVTLSVSARGLTTGPIPYGALTFQVDFDFVDHALAVTVCDGREASMPLSPMSVADFYRDFVELLASLDLRVHISPRPNEVPNPIPFAQDRIHAAYDPVYANRCFLALAHSDRVFRRFSSGYLGKVSPVQFFWGAFDLAVTRFSGRPAPRHPGGVPGLPDHVVHEAYSHEVSSAGFWPGDARLPEPAYFSYTYPEPPGFNRANIEPAGAYYHEKLYEWILPYAAVSEATDPDAVLLRFLQTTYEAGATLGGWDRETLERPAQRVNR
jgi:hypothetical protein